MNRNFSSAYDASALNKLSLLACIDGFLLKSSSQLDILGCDPGSTTHGLLQDGEH